MTESTQFTSGVSNNAISTGRRSLTSNPFIRWFRALVWTIFVLVTSLAFPEHLAALTAVIVVVIFSLLAFERIREAGMVSIVAGTVLAIKTPSIQFEFILLVAILLASGVAYFRVSTKRRWTAFAVSVAAVAFFGIKRTYDAQSGQEILLDNSGSIVCLGDSLTEGMNGGYPAELQKICRQRVINFGRNGYTTQMAIDDLLPKILAEQPQLVVMELGGHDYNTGEPRNQTKARLRQIIQVLTDADVEVVVIEIPRGFISDPFYGVERELAAEFDLQLIPDTIIRRFVYFSAIAPPGIWLSPSEHLSKDGLHPNERGQIEFAKVVAAAISGTQDSW